MYLLEWLSQNTSKGFQLRVEEGNRMAKYTVKNRQYGNLTIPRPCENIDGGERCWSCN